MMTVHVEPVVFSEGIQCGHSARLPGEHGFVHVERYLNIPASMYRAPPEHPQSGLEFGLRCPGEHRSVQPKHVAVQAECESVQHEYGGVKGEYPRILTLCLDFKET